MKKIYLLFIVIFIIVFFGCQVSLSHKDRCESFGGLWNDEYHECIGITDKHCQAIGGHYDNCASPCRHDKDAQVCIEICEMVCVIK